MSPGECVFVFSHFIYERKVIIVFKNLSYNLKRAVAGLCAVLIVGGAVPMQPVADFLKSTFTFEVAATEYSGSVSVADLRVGDVVKGGSTLTVNGTSYVEICPIIDGDEKDFCTFYKLSDEAGRNFRVTGFYDETSSGDHYYYIFLETVPNVIVDSSANGLITDAGFTGYFEPKSQVTIHSKGKLTFKRLNNKGVQISWSSANYAESKDLDNNYTYSFIMPEHDLYLSHEHNLVVEYSNNVDVLFAGCSDENSGMKKIVEIAAQDDVYDPAAAYDGAAKTKTDGNLPTGVQMAVSDIYYTNHLFQPVAFPGGIFPVGEYYANVDVQINGEEYTIYDPFEITAKSIADKDGDVYDVTFTVTPDEQAYQHGLDNAFSVTATYNGVALVEGDNSDGKDFTYEITPPAGKTAYNNGVYTITVTGHGNYTGTRTFTYNINAADVSEAVTFTTENKVYDAAAYGAKTDNVNGYTITGTGDLANEFLGEATKTVTYYALPYCEGTTLEVGKFLKPGVRYRHAGSSTIYYPSDSQPGSYDSQTIEGTDDPVYYVDKTNVLVCDNESAGYIECAKAAAPGLYWMVYYADEDHVDIKCVRIDSNVDDYAIEGAPKDVGHYVAKAVIASESGNFQPVTKYSEFDITKKPVEVKMSNFGVTNAKLAYTAHSNAQILDPDQIEIYGDVNGAKVEETGLVKLTKNGEAVTGTYADAGTYTYAIDNTVASTGVNANYSFTIRNPELTIAPLDLTYEHEWITFTQTNAQKTFVYDSLPHTATFTLTNTRIPGAVENTNYVLVEDTDYTVINDTAINVAGAPDSFVDENRQYIATVFGKYGSNYTGSFTFTWAINPLNLFDADMTLAPDNGDDHQDQADTDYTGETINVTETVKYKVHYDMDSGGPDSDIEETLTRSPDGSEPDYTVSYKKRDESDGNLRDTSSIKEAGEYLVTVTATPYCNYTGSTSRLYYVNKAIVTPLNFKLALNDTVYDGEAKTLADFTFSTPGVDAVSDEVVAGYRADGEGDTKITDVKYCLLDVDTDGTLEVGEYIAPGSVYTFNSRVALDVTTDHITYCVVPDNSTGTVTISADNTLTVSIPALDNYSNSFTAPVGYVWKITDYTDNYQGYPYYKFQLVPLATQNLLVFSEGLPTDAGYYAVWYTLTSTNIKDATLYDTFVINKRPVTVTADNKSKEFLGAPVELSATPAAFDKGNGTGVVAGDNALPWNTLLEVVDSDNNVVIDGWATKSEQDAINYQLDAGTYKIVAKATVPPFFSNYEVTVKPGTYTVDPYDLAAHYYVDPTADEPVVKADPDVAIALAPYFDEDFAPDEGYAFYFNGEKHGVKIAATIGEMPGLNVRYKVGETSFYYGLTNDAEQNLQTYVLGGDTIRSYSGEYSVDVMGVGNFTGTISKPWTITVGAATGIAAYGPEMLGENTPVVKTYDGGQVSYDVFNVIPPYDYDTEDPTDLSTLDNLDGFDFVIYTGNYQNPEVEVSYYDRDGLMIVDDDGDPTAPVNAGNYTVKVTVTDKEANFDPPITNITFRLIIRPVATHLRPVPVSRSYTFGDELPVAEDIEYAEYERINTGTEEDPSYEDQWTYDDYTDNAFPLELDIEAEDDESLKWDDFKADLLKCVKSKDDPLGNPAILLYVDEDCDEYKALREKYKFLRNYSLIFDEAVVEVNAASLYDVEATVYDIALKPTGFTNLQTALASLTFDMADGTTYELDPGVDFVFLGSTSKNKAGTYTVEIEGIGKFKDGKRLTVNVVGIQFTGHTLNLGDAIGVNFYVDFKGIADIQDAYVIFNSNRNNNFRIDIEDAAVNKTERIFTLPIAPAEMSDDITCDVYVNGEIVISETYKARQYCETMIARNPANQFQINRKQTCIALLNYAAQVQLFFNYNTADLANQYLTKNNIAYQKTNSIVDFDEILTDDYTKYWTPAERASLLSDNGIYDIEYTGATLNLESTVSIRHYFKVKEGTVEEAIKRYKDRITINGKGVSFTISKYSNSEFVVETDGINSVDLTKDSLFGFSIDGIVMLDKYSINTYARSYFERGTESAMKRVELVRNMYYYSCESSNMFGR